VKTAEFLTLLGKDLVAVRLRGFYHADNPKKAGDRGYKGGFDERLVQRWQAEGRGVYYVVNDGGDKDADITGCRAFFCEFDDRPREQQIDFWQVLGLPAPTVQVDTGGKSIHTYWVLEEPIEPEVWRGVQTRLLDYVDGDRTLKNPSRVMRLPGTRHAGGDGVHLLIGGDRGVFAQQRRPGHSCSRGKVY
jgi:hypothetical protein